MTIFKLSLAAFVALMVGAWAEGAKAGVDAPSGADTPVCQPVAVGPAS